VAAFILASVGSPAGTAGGYKTRPYGIELWSPDAICIDVVAGFIPASLVGGPAGGHKARSYTRQIPNTKSQMLNNFKAQNTNTRGVWNSEFRYWDLFRISCFEFGARAVVAGFIPASVGSPAETAGRHKARPYRIEFPNHHVVVGLVPTSGGGDGLEQTSPRFTREK
jgi:hypothetical protein